MAKLDVNGVKLNVQQLGAGRPVVFVHGLVMDNLSSWYFTVANRVARSARAILYDLRGHGMSERPPSGYRLDDMVSDLDGVVDGLDLDEPVTLIGNSFGGMLAVAYAAARPERTAGLVLVDAHLSGPGWGDAMARTLELQGAQRDELIAETFKSWLGRHSRRKRSRLARNAAELVYDTTLVRDLRDSAELADEALAAITCPVLAIYGQDSDARIHGEHLAAVLPACELRLLPGCTHSVLWEATESLRDAIAAWVDAPVPAASHEGVG